MGLFIIGVLCGLLSFYTFGLSLYTAEIKHRVEKLEKAIKQIETYTKDQNSIATTTDGSNVDHEHND